MSQVVDKHGIPVHVPRGPQAASVPTPEQLRDTFAEILRRRARAAAIKAQNFSRRGKG